MRILGRIDTLSLNGQTRGVIGRAVNGTSGDDTLNSGAGADTLNGGAGNDRLNGGAGNDWLDGGTGVDLLWGGIGNDTYIVDNTGDIVTELANEGAEDKVMASISYTLTANVEQLVLTGGSNINGEGNALNNLVTGNGGSNQLWGFAGDDTLNGDAGNDSLFGGDGSDSLIGGTGNDLLDGGTGADMMIGGRGDDVYYRDSLSDTIYENEGEGIDTIYSSITAGIPLAVENVTLVGTADINSNGNAKDNVLIGNVGRNQIFGDFGNDTIVGGAGADTMIGGAGDDIFYVDDQNDIVKEDASQGIDTIYSSVNFTLNNQNNPGSAVENLYLTGSASINGDGNELNNALIGNGGNNILKSYSGNDYLSGEGGDDTLVGVSGNDTLVGGAGNDFLSGGTENDTLLGGAGNDTFAFQMYSGKDSILDFEAGLLGGDVLQMQLGYGTRFDTYKEVMDVAYNFDGGVIFKFDSNTTITVYRVSKESFTEGDFLFI